MTAHSRSRLRFARGEGVREQGTKPGTLATGQVLRASCRDPTLVFVVFGKNLTLYVLTIETGMEETAAVPVKIVGEE